LQKQILVSAGGGERLTGLAQQLLMEIDRNALTAATVEQRLENLTMYHTIEFRVDYTVDLESSPKYPQKRMLIRQGTRVRTQLMPYVEETEIGPIEVADLFFEDGTVTRSVPFASFSFVEERNASR